MSLAVDSFPESNLKMAKTTSSIHTIKPKAKGDMVFGMQYIG